MHGSPDKFAQDKRIREQLDKIKYPIIVMSGKGGVGKSTVSVNLAFSLAQEGHRVGIMDVDIHGPNIPKMLGIEDKQFGGSDEAIEPVQVLPNLWAASIGLIGYHPDQALIWRGPIKVGLIRQFIGDMLWGELDYLVIDTPPGTGDETLTLAQQIPNLAGAVIVTTPQDVSILDSRKSVDFANKLKVPILGIVENMSGFVCPHCNTVTHIFKEGGGKKAGEELGVPFLGAIPLEPSIVTSGDSGKPFIHENKDSVSAQAFREIIKNMKSNLASFEAQGVYDKPSVPIDFKPER